MSILRDDDMHYNSIEIYTVPGMPVCTYDKQMKKEKYEKKKKTIST